MGRRLRFLPPDSSLVEVTVRTVQSRFLLKPSPGFGRTVVGALARAKSLYPVQVHAVACLSNHLHLLLSATNSAQLANFMRHFNTKLSKEAGRLHDWSGPLLQRRYQAIPVSGEEAAQVARLRYILEQGCKENLVLRPRDWPGAHSAQALCSGKPMPGIWHDRTAEYNARRSADLRPSSEFVEEQSLELDPLPCWVGERPAWQRRQIRNLVRDIEAETAARHEQEGSRPLGRRAILRQHPHASPRLSKKSPAPRFHAASREARLRFLQAHAWFVEAFRAAAERLRRGDWEVEFPAGSFPPPRAFKAAPAAGYG